MTTTKTITLISPAGNLEIWPESEKEAKLAQGYSTEEAWAEQCAAKAAEEHAAWLANPETEAERFAMLRAARDLKLSATDYLLAADYPVSPEKKEAVIAYRQALRDLPSQEGAPWDGGGELTPWPEKP